MQHPEWLLGLGLFGLLMCSQPQVLRDPVAEPVMQAGPVARNPLPAVAAPTGAPPVERDPAPDAATP